MRISDWSSDVCSSDLAAAAPAKDKRKLGFKQARELEQLPARIEALEMRIAELTAAMNDPAFYQRDSAAIHAHNADVAEAQDELDAASARWDTPEDAEARPVGAMPDTGQATANTQSHA